MDKKRTTGMILALVAIATALLSGTPASADVSPPDIWVKSQDFQSHYLCRGAGLTGEFFGLWRSGDWKCEDATLFVRQPASSSADV